MFWLLFAPLSTCHEPQETIQTVSQQFVVLIVIVLKKLEGTDSVDSTDSADGASIVCGADSADGALCTVSCHFTVTCAQGREEECTERYFGLHN